MTQVVNLAEEVLSGVLQAAEHLQGAIVAADTGCVESLRWSGAIPLLLRDLSVQNVLPVEDLLACESPQTLRHLLSVQDPNESVEHVVLLLSDFLWDYETALQRLLALGVARRVTVCSSLSERAHECYDFSKSGIEVATGAKAAQVMNFQRFSQELRKNAVIRTEKEGEVKDEEEWGWDDTETEPMATQVDVQVIHLPLNVVPLLSAKTLNPEPSVFVLSHPTCASAFPLLLHQVKNTLPVSPSERRGKMFHAVEGVKKYTHVKDVLPEDIPGSFRKSMRLLAHTLAEMVVNARLNVKERIFAVGGTSLKIGHTLLRILNELQEEATPLVLQDQQPASLVIIDRTSNLVSPCSFGDSLLDRVLALLPQTPTTSTEARNKTITREKLNVTDIFPLHGCDPTPLSMSAPLVATFDELGVVPSPFVSQIQWKGGASLCHPNLPSGSNMFRSLAFRPAKLALRDLDKRLQAVEQEMLEQGKIQKTAATRRPGEKVRGRDVVLRRISKILEPGEPTSLEYTALIELGIIVLETLERMDQSQVRWNKCRKQAVRHVELRKQGGCEWILPEVADLIQRQVSAVQSSNPQANEENISLQEVLTLLVHAFALSSGVSVDDFTIQMVQKALVETVLQAVRVNPLSVQTALPQLYEQLSPYIESSARHLSSDHCNDTEGDDWDWDNGNNSPSVGSNKRNEEVELTALVESYVESLMDTLQDCALQFANIVNEDATTTTTDTLSQSLVTQLCQSIVDPSGASISEIQHIVDASEQLTRAGIDLLKSGFSKFGFGVGGGDTDSQRGINSSRVMGNSNILVVFVVGGITFEEIQQVHDVLSSTSKYQVLLGGTTITNNEVILKKLFTF